MTVVKDDLTDMSAMQIRLYMRKHGWDSEEQITTNGWKNNYCFSIWFRRHEWHGRRTFALIGHEVFFHNFTNDLSESNINDVVRKCALLSLKAYRDFPKSIPFMSATGKLLPDIMFADWNDKTCFVKNKHK